jgi:hypothetical protein
VIASYADFTLTKAEAVFGLLTQGGTLFPDLSPLPVPEWLREMLNRAQRLTTLGNRKACAEFVVGPILMAACELSASPVSICSGQPLNVDPARGLLGKCDFLLTRTPPLRRMRAPCLIVTVARNVDMDASLGPCVAQMVGARLFNERSGRKQTKVYGAVTTGETWLFLRLEGKTVTLDRVRLSFDNLRSILAVLHGMLTDSPPSTSGTLPTT